MPRCETVRAHLVRMLPPFAEDPPGSGVYVWRTRLGRWPFEAQVDRFALEVRCYLADELFCTGRLPDEEADALIDAGKGAGDERGREDLAAFVDREVGLDSRRFLQPPHADRHPDRRADPRMDPVIRQKPPRVMDEPA